MSSIKASKFAHTKILDTRLSRQVTARPLSRCAVRKLLDQVRFGFNLGQYVKCVTTHVLGNFIVSAGTCCRNGLRDNGSR
jgi:hypothetical protein